MRREPTDGAIDHAYPDARDRIRCLGAGDADSYDPAISADGRFVAFYSDAGNLVAGDTNDEGDIFVRDRTNRTTGRVSTSGARAAEAPSSSAGPTP